MKKRTQSREYAVQMMYQSEMMECSPAEVMPIFWKSFDKVAEDVMEFAESLFSSAYSRKEGHDHTIKQFLRDGWSLERLGEMEKCVLRVAIDELLHSDTPAYAVLDDYVTLARRFTDEKTASFVNGILERIRGNL